MNLKAPHRHFWTGLIACLTLGSLLWVAQERRTSAAACAGNDPAQCESQGTPSPESDESTALQRLDWRSLLPAALRRRARW